MIHRLLSALCLFAPLLASGAPIVRHDPLPGGTADDANLAAGFFNHSLAPSLSPPFHNWALKNAAFPALDPAVGFRLGFDLALRDEDHDTDHRAGFSVILLGQDRRGIELGFWENQVFAQGGPDFLQAEQVAFDTTRGLIRYEFTVLLDDYLLRADGTTVLTGLVRDDSPASPFPDPYDTPNMLFLGDNTGSGSADFTLGHLRP